MIPAAEWPRDEAKDTRALRVLGDRPIQAGTSLDFERWIDARAVVVVNDAATVPASLSGTTSEGAAIEARLAEMVRASSDGAIVARAVLFGAGDWRTPTERRPRPPTVRAGEALALGPLRATVERVEPAHPRLVSLRFHSANVQTVLAGLYAHGRPVQYSYVRESLALWHVQTPLASRPVAVEAPSSGYALSWAILARLRARGVTIAAVTHGTGLSSTGDEALDRVFPLDERYEIRARAASVINAAIAERRPVIVVGTGAMRAIESSARGNAGRVREGCASTALRLGPSERATVTTGIITGLHEPGSSHASLLESLVSREAVERAARVAEREGMRAHEFGDAMLVERV
ncbi:MAG: S-adenosylmethionine:tRNA ribosyltransferase-isomerase [Polyangiales bacterium]